jgi:hypothetical protein
MNLLRRLINALVDRYACGEITMPAGVTPITLTVQNTWYPIVANWVADQVHNTTLTAAAGTITSDIAGQYWIITTISFTSDVATEIIEFGTFKNDAVILDHVATTWADTATYPNTVTVSGIDALDVGDVLSLRVRCTSTAGVVLVPTRGNFSIASIGGSLR